MATPLKEYYNKEFTQSIATVIKTLLPNFKEKQFFKTVHDSEWEARELKERSTHINATLNLFLPDEYPKALEILLKVQEQFTGLTHMTFPQYVGTFGQEFEDLSLKALESMTINSTSEFGIRPFLQKNPEKVFQRMLKWSNHKNEHVRRLSSEGCRPRLPWGQGIPALKKDPSLILPILENLKADPSEYVRRSVANNLNDISKDHPEIVIDIIRSWKGENDLTDKLLKHASRTLLKKGHPIVLELFGYGLTNGIEVNNLTLSKETVKIGEGFTFSFDVSNSNTTTATVRLEYVIHFLRPSGQYSIKQFQISDKDISTNEHISIKRKQAFKDLTIRKHYPGEHKIEIIGNGKKLAEETFHLISQSSKHLHE